MLCPLHCERLRTSFHLLYSRLGIWSLLVSPKLLSPLRVLQAPPPRQGGDHGGVIKKSYFLFSRFFFTGNRWDRNSMEVIPKDGSSISSLTIGILRIKSKNCCMNFQLPRSYPFLVASSSSSSRFLFLLLILT